MAERGRYDDIFLKTDTDLDGFVSGQEVKEIFMHSGLSQNILAHVWYVLKWLPPPFTIYSIYISVRFCLIIRDYIGVVCIVALQGSSRHQADR